MARTRSAWSPAQPMPIYQDCVRCHRFPILTSPPLPNLRDHPVRYDVACTDAAISECDRRLCADIVAYQSRELFHQMRRLCTWTAIRGPRQCRPCSADPCIYAIVADSLRNISTFSHSIVFKREHRTFTSCFSKSITMMWLSFRSQRRRLRLPKRLRLQSTGTSDCLGSSRASRAPRSLAA